MKTKVNLSLDEETAKMLKELAKENHSTISQLVTQWVWAQLGKAIFI